MWYLIQARSQAKTCGTIVPKVYGVDNGLDVKPDKQIIKPLSTPIQSHVSTKSKDQYHVKSRLGHGRAGIKKKMLRWPMPQPYDKPKQLK